MRYLKTNWYRSLVPVDFWYQWHVTHAGLLVRVGMHQLLVPETGQCDIRLKRFMGRPVVPVVLAL